MSDGDESVREAAMDALARLGYYNHVTGGIKARGFYRTQKPRTSRGPRLGPDGKPVPRKPGSALSRRVLVEVGATVRIWWPEDSLFYAARVKAWDRETDTHTIVYIDDEIEETVDLSKEKAELRYKPHKRGANEKWMACGMNKKQPKVQKEPKQPKRKREAGEGRGRGGRVKKEKPPKVEKAKIPKKAEVTIETVGKGEVVPAGTTVRIWWPLDKAWYGGKVQGYVEATAMHTAGPAGCRPPRHPHAVLFPRSLDLAGIL